MPETILVVAAHPDDEVLGCGGTLARLTDEGHSAVVAVLSAGASSRRPGDEQERRQQAALRDAMDQAAAALRVDVVRQFDFPDNVFDSIPLLEVVRAIEGLIEEFKPAAVLTHHAGDLNVDHAITSRAVLTATRPQGGNPVRSVLAFEVPSSTEWSFGTMQPVFVPNVFVDIADSLERKVSAMQAYTGESRPFPHPRSPEALRMLAGIRGATSGLQAAEAFMLVRHICSSGMSSAGFPW